jgi:hypothetical protein
LCYINTTEMHQQQTQGRNEKEVVRDS